MAGGNLFATIQAAAPDPSSVLAELPDGTVATYGDAFALAARFAHVLQRAGVGPGDRVAVQVEKSWPAVVLYLGCLRAGAVYLPLNPALHAGRGRLLPPRRRAGRVRLQPGAARRPGPGRRRGRRGSTGDDGPRGSGLAPGGRRRARRPSASTSSVTAATWRPSSTPPARPGARRAPCSRTTTCAPTRWRWSSAGASRPTTCSCTPCPSSTPTACSWPRTWCCCRAAR